LIDSHLFLVTFRVIKEVSGDDLNNCQFYRGTLRRVCFLKDTGISQIRQEEKRS